MYYYLVAPATNKYHGLEGLTYSSVQKLPVGQVISVGIRRAVMAGFITKSVAKPTFKTQPITSVLNNLQLRPEGLDFFQWLKAYYPSPIGPLASHFLPATILTTSKKLVATPQSLQVPPKNSVVLSSEQQATIEAVNNTSSTTFLLHGETGSGKTRVYIELARQALASGTSSLILTPEIGLTPQLLNLFTKEFGDAVTSTHSSLGELKRKNLWLELIGVPSPRVLIGPRSALFMPLQNIGLIVLDEFHDSAYKQENSPRYQAIRAASTLAKLHGAKLILGSATPSVNEYFLAQQKNIPVLRMTSKPSTKTPDKMVLTTQVVDLSNTGEKTKHPLISQTLVKKLTACLSRHEQAIIFLNKRGSARVVVCKSCGWQAACPNCDLPLTYHEDSHVLRCHTCGHSQATPGQCPACKSSDIFFKSPGTKAIVSSLTNLFPEANIVRFDKDNKKAERLESRHAEVVDGTIDILVGTQLLGKGHDLPKLGLVGILLAESGLSFPDYTSEERSFQLIHQLMGRVGRGHRPGTVVLQTFEPNNPTIRSAIAGDWGNFYSNQLVQRQKFGFPPFFHVMKIAVARKSQKSAEAAINKLMHQVRGAAAVIVTIGPSPCFLERQHGTWRWQLIVKSKQRAKLVEIAKTLSKDCVVDIDPAHLL